MSTDLIQRLLAEELPGERQYQREARVVLASLLREAAEHIQRQNRLISRIHTRRQAERESYGKIVTGLKEELATLRSFMGLKVDQSNNRAYKTLEQAAEIDRLKKKVSDLERKLYPFSGGGTQI